MLVEPEYLRPRKWNQTELNKKARIDKLSKQRHEIKCNKNRKRRKQKK